jgi:hypothetical protein
MDLTALHRFHIAPGYDPALPATWVWSDQSADVNHVNGGVTITGGRGDETNEVEASSALLEVDNAGGHYCSENPLGRWYGQLAIGCPARWGTISGAEAFTADTTNGWGTPDVGISWQLISLASLFSSSGGVGLLSVSGANVFHSAVLVGADARNGEATFVGSVPAVSTGATVHVALLARRTVGVNQIWFAIDFGLAGVLGVRIKRDTAGSLVDITTGTAAATYSANQRIKARCQWDGQDLRMRVWPEAGSEPTTWTAVATDTQCVGAAVGMAVLTAPGNTNSYPFSFSIDNIEIEAVEITGSLPELPVRWDPTASVSWAPLEIAGITRRLSQGDDVIESPIHRQLLGQPYAAYWPLEDDGGTARAASAVARGTPAVITGGVLGNTDCPPGALSSLTLTTAGTSRLSGRVKTWSLPTDGYAGMCYFKLPSTPAATQQRLMQLSAVGTVATWIIYISSTQFTVEGYAADGTLLLSPGGTVYTINPLQWTALQFEAQEVGGNVNWTLIGHQVGSSTFFVEGSGSFAGTADRLAGGYLYAPVDGTLVSNFWLGDDLLAFVDIPFMLVSAAYPGELDTARITRIFGEKGIPVSIESGTGEPLGPQKLGQVLDVARDAEAAGMGILYETGAGYGYRPLPARYNRAVNMTLAISPTGDIGDQPQPATQDLRTRNFWKVNRDGGSSGTDSDTAHIARYGRRPDSTTINVYTDDVLQDNASWRVHLGTWGEMRWPQLVLDLTDRPTQLAAWRGRPFGARITVSGVPSQGPIGANLDLIVEGWSQEITSNSWRATVNCSPAKPWDVGIYTDTTRRYDSSSTTLGSSVTSSGTTLVFSSALAGDQWSQTSAYDVLIAGEVIGVPVAGMSAPSGTGPFTQTATGCTRAKNGIVKALNAGEPIHVATPGRYAL